MDIGGGVVPILLGAWLIFKSYRYRDHYSSKREQTRSRLFGLAFIVAGLVITAVVLQHRSHGN